VADGLRLAFAGAFDADRFYGVIRIQPLENPGSLYSERLCASPLAGLRKLTVTERVRKPENCNGCRPLGRSKKVGKAVGRQICAVENQKDEPPLSGEARHRKSFARF
jgi:hypothetical protein